MKPVDQTLFGQGRGNCFAACVASLLELNIDDVPNFCVAPGNWYLGFARWLHARGYAPIVIAPFEGLNLYYNNIYLIAGGPCASESPDRRGGMHACVYRGIRLVHDPNPERSGLLSVLEYTAIVPERLV